MAERERRPCLWRRGLALAALRDLLAIARRLRHSGQRVLYREPRSRRQCRPDFAPRPVALGRERHRLFREGRFSGAGVGPLRSDEHTSELQSLMRISYAVFFLNKKQHKISTQVKYN